MTRDINFEIVGKLLVLLREKSGKEQQEVAKALNVSKAAVSLWESGNGIQTEKIYDLARYYNITVAELISGQLSDENEEDYLQRNYDLSNHPSFETIDETNYKDLLDYLSRCSNVIKRVFKLYPSYLSYSLTRKESNEFNVLMSYFTMDYPYTEFMNYDSFCDSLRNIIEELQNTRGFEKPEDLDDELAAIYELKIDVNPYEVIAFNKETSDKYLSLLRQPQKDELLTNYLVDKEIEEIEESIVVKRLLNAGARCLFKGEDFLRARENFDEDVLEGLEGKVVESKKLEDVYNHFKKAEADANSHSDKYFDPCSWKRLTKKGYGLIVDEERTEDIKAIAFWRVEKPKLYMDYLEKKQDSFNHN